MTTKTKNLYEKKKKNSQVKILKKFKFCIFNKTFYWKNSIEKRNSLKTATLLKQLKQPYNFNGIHPNE